MVYMLYKVTNGYKIVFTKNINSNFAPNHFLETSDNHIYQKSKYHHKPILTKQIQ